MPEPVVPEEKDPPSNFETVVCAVVIGVGQLFQPIGELFPKDDPEEVPVEVTPEEDPD